MRHVLLSAAMLMLCIVAATAQGGDTIAPLGVTNPVYVGTFSTGPHVLASKGGREGKSAWMVAVFLTQAGQPEYTINVNSVTLLGDVDVFDTMTAIQVFDLIAAKTVLLAVDSGYVACPPSGTAGAGVTLHSCVARTTNSYEAIGSILNRRAYSYSCTTVGLTDVEGAFGCGTGSEATADWSAYIH